MKSTFSKESFFSVPQQALFEFHERRDAFSLLTPPSEGIEVLSTASTLAPSSDIVRFVTSFLFLKFKFEMIHTVYQPFDLFVDEQKSGLFSSWRHQHRFLPGGWKDDPAVLLQDRIEYGHPLGRFLRPFVNHRLGKLFAFRHQATSEELQKISRSPSRSEPSTVIITGATGLIGAHTVLDVRKLCGH
jgi:ligand-binding SRPBCC domain-containing protein